jgi:hypothetical protein
MNRFYSCFGSTRLDPLWVTLCVWLIASAVAAEESVHVSDQPSVSFVNEVVPILSRFGCNAGSCHGSATGKDGFALSLFGYDPAGDYRALIRELPGRRVNLAMPAESLLLEKATGSVPHTGGKLFEKTSEPYKRLLRWIRESPDFDGETAAKVASVSMTPPEVVLERHQAMRQIQITAEYDDDTTRDVTSLATFTSNDPGVVGVSETGQLVAAGPGETIVLARFGAHTVACRVIVHREGETFVWLGEQAETNYIDEAIQAKLRKLRVAPAAVCSDAEFIRRISIDLSGRLPSREQLASFVAIDDPDKRAKLIDRMLDTEDFERLWTMKWLELFKTRTTNRVFDKSIWKFSRWLREQIHDGVPIRQWLTTMITATGSEFENPPVVFLHELPNHKQVAEDVAQVFLGMRIQCAQCHNHPFDRWTMDDYYGFVAFFDHARRKRGNDPRERIVFNVNGRTIHPVTKERVSPRFLGGVEPDLREIDQRQALADWITSDDNPYFAKNLANRIWAQFFGFGIVNEVDDVRVSNPPINRRLLEQLAERLKETDFDFKALARDICNSQAYQRSTVGAGDTEVAERNFAKARVRRVRAEVLLDMISQVTETRDDFDGLPEGASATEIPDGKTTNHFLSTFGQSSRKTVCACEVNTQPNLSQALHLINGDTIQKKIVKGRVIDRLMKSKVSNRDIVDELYLRCLSRSPTDLERDALVDQIRSSDNRKQALQDIFWALLNSREFLFNH